MGEVELTAPKMPTITMQEQLDPLIEGALDLLRTAVFAVIPLLLLYLESGKEIDWQLIGITALIAVLKALDRAKHVQLKNNQVIDGKGMLPF